MSETRPLSQLEPGGDSGVAAGFQWKLLAAVGLLVVALTALGIYAAGRAAAARAQDDSIHKFESALAELHHVRDVRYREIAGRCDALVRNPRIHAALEDDALDLLYFNARDQLHDLVYGHGHPGETPGAPPASPANPEDLRATFYRFLDARGAMIPPPTVRGVGELTTLEEQQLALPALPEREQIGYLVRTAGEGRGTVNEVITVPITSSETGERISALMVGFEPTHLWTARAREGGGETEGDTFIQSGVWVNGALYLPAFGEEARAQVEGQVGRAVGGGRPEWRCLQERVTGTPHLVHCRLLNSGSVLPPAYEVCAYSLAGSLAAQRRQRWEIAGAGVVVLLGGLGASHGVSRRFSAPVARLASDSAEQREQRARAEAALETTSRELQRAARFSADASHQLKTPVTVLRAGLEEVLARDHLPEGSRDEIADLIHQTYRLNNVIEDLLLLSRMDAGRLRLEPGRVNLVDLVEAWLDDLSALPDPLELTVETDLPPGGLAIAGEKRYTTLIVQNLLENARKYNRLGGRVHVGAFPDAGGGARLVVGNTGKGIAPGAREHIFERFHRGAAGENVPGHGLGLNLARELARLHGGSLRLVRSGDDWTEFEAVFRLASDAENPEAPGPVPPA